MDGQGTVVPRPQFEAGPKYFLPVTMYRTRVAKAMACQAFRGAVSVWIGMTLAAGTPDGSAGRGDPISPRAPGARLCRSIR